MRAALELLAGMAIALVGYGYIRDLVRIFTGRSRCRHGNDLNCRECFEDRNGPIDVSPRSREADRECGR